MSLWDWLKNEVAQARYYLPSTQREVEQEAAQPITPAQTAQAFERRGSSHQTETGRRWQRAQEARRVQEAVNAKPDYMRKSARQSLEDMLGKIAKPVGDGGIGAGIMFQHASQLYQQNLISQDEYAHYVRAGMKQQLADGDSGDAAYLHDVTRELPEWYGWLKSQVDPDKLISKELGYSPVVGMETRGPTAQALEDAAAKVRDGSMNLGAFYQKVLHSELSPEGQQRLLTMGTLAAGLPAASTPVADPVERTVQSALTPLAMLSVPGQIIDSLALGRAGGLTWNKLKLITAEATRGRIVVNPIGERMAALSEDATPNQKLGAAALGFVETIATDPLSYLGIGVEWAPALAKAGRAASARGVAVGARRLGLAPEIANDLKAAVAEVLPNIDVLAFSKGSAPGDVDKMGEAVVDVLLRWRGVDGARPAPGAIVRAGERAASVTAREQATEDAKIIISEVQQRLRPQMRLWGREGAPLRTPPFRDIREVVQQRAERVLNLAMKRADRALPNEQATAFLAQGLDVPLEELSLVQRETEMARQLSLMAGKQGTGMLPTLRRWFSPMGNTPSDLYAPLQIHLTTYEHNVGRFTTLLNTPLRGLSDDEVQTVARIIGMEPRTVKTEAFAHAFGVPVGEVAGVNARDRLKYLLMATGEYKDDAQVERMLRYNYEGIADHSPFIERRLSGKTGAAPSAEAIAEPLPVGYEREIVVDALPPKAKRLWTASRETMAGYKQARDMLVEAGYELGDEGLPYIPRRTMGGAEVGADVATPQVAGRPFFMHEATTENPVWSQWMSAAGYKFAPQYTLDLRATGRAYGMGMAQSLLVKDLKGFAETYGMRGMDQSLAAAMGWRPLTMENRVTDIDAILNARPEFLPAFRETMLPYGVTDYINHQLAGAPKWIAQANRFLTPMRLAVLNSVVFPVSQLPDQVANIGLGTLAGLEKMPAGSRIVTRALMADLLEAAEASAPRGVVERLRLGLTQGGVGLHDAIDEKLFEPLARNSTIGAVMHYLDLAGADPELKSQIAHELVHTDLRGLGPGGWLRDMEVGKIPDEVLRNTLGWGVRVGGAFEDFAMMSRYASLRLSGMSSTDAYRQLFRGFVHYGRAAQSPVDEAMRVLFFFFTYLRQRSGQVIRALSDRPFLSYLMLRGPDAWAGGILTPEQKQLWDSRPDAEKIQLQRFPSRWDLPPFSWYADDVPENIKNSTIPSVSVRLAGWETFGDLGRMAGIGGTSQGEPLHTLFQNLHPLLQAAGYASIGNWRKAGDTLKATIPGRDLWELYHPGQPDAREIQSLYRRAGISLTQGKPADPTVTDSLIRLDNIRRQLRWNSGTLTQFSFIPHIAKTQTAEQRDDWNDIRAAAGKPRVAYSDKQVAEIADRVIALGLPKPTAADINAYIAAGNRGSDYLADLTLTLTRRREQEIGLEDWKKSYESGEDVPFTSRALAEHNAIRAARKLPPMSLEQAETMRQQMIPATTYGMVRMGRNQIDMQPGYCARALANALGHSQAGCDAWQMGPTLEAWGFHRVEDAPRPGDILLYPKRNHVGFAAMNPATNELSLLSNSSAVPGRASFMPVGDDFEVYRPSEISRLEYELQHPDVLPTQPTSSTP